MTEQLRIGMNDSGCPAAVPRALTWSVEGAIHAEHQARGQATTRTNSHVGIQTECSEGAGEKNLSARSNGRLQVSDDRRRG
jgi:hypothetical protein